MAACITAKKREEKGRGGNKGNEEGKQTQEREEGRRHEEEDKHRMRHKREGGGVKKITRMKKTVYKHKPLRTSIFQRGRRYK